VGETMKSKIISALEELPVIAAVRDRFFEPALNSPASVIFLLGGDISTIGDKIRAAKEKGKFIFVHIDLTDGIGKDKSGLKFLYSLGADGILSTRGNLIKFAKEIGFITIQRFFVYDSYGVNGIEDMVNNTKPDFIEIMPGLIDKITARFSKGITPLIAGGLIETKQEITNALNSGAFAVSTGKEELWNM
jgi:glycerol uptake operon antiterminator